MKRNNILAFVLVAILSISVSAFAAEHVEKIEAFLVNDLKFNVDGEAWTPKDVDGSPLTPINYKGRTYVPVRSLLEDKGVTVGYEDDTRTVLLDYSTIKRLDKSTPLLMTATSGGGGSGKATFKEFTLTLNPDFDLGNISMEQEFMFELESDTTIFIDEQRVEGSIEDIMKQAPRWTMESMNVAIDEETGEVTSIMITSLDDSTADQQLLARVEVEIEISGPPWKLRIRIRF